MKDHHARVAKTKIGKMMAWEYAAFGNYEIIESDIWEAAGTEGAIHPDLSKYKDKYKDIPAIILGSGPSLDNSVQYLREWEGLILCGPTQALILKFHGIDPTHIVVLDPGNNPNQLGLYPAEDGVVSALEWPKTTLLAPPIVNPYVTKFWPGPRVYFRVVSMTADLDRHIMDMGLTWDEYVEKYKPKGENPAYFYIPDEHTIFFNSVLTNVYARSEALWTPKGRGIQQQVAHAGSTPNTAVMIAGHVYGCRPIFMVGCDNGFTRGKGRATGYSVTPGPEWEMIPATSPHQDGTAHPEVVAGMEFEWAGVKTVPQLWFYQRLLVHMTVSSTPNDLFVLEAAHNGEYGVNDFFPQVEVADVVKWQGKGFGDLFEPRAERKRKFIEWDKTAPKA